MHSPYLTSEIPGIGGLIKQRPEDFLVQEIPAYEPSGQGEHLLCLVRKSGLSTFAVIRKIAEQLNLNPRDIGYAGLKDTQAITEQHISIPGVPAEHILALQIDGVSIPWAVPHGNKLRMGHLQGNRFTIKIRDVQSTDVIRAQSILDIISRIGMPNYFGQQRFGMRGDNHLLGAALLRGDNVALLKQLLGHPDPALDDAASIVARRQYESGDLEGSMRKWPRRCGIERRALARFIASRRPTAAVYTIDRQLRLLWVSATQSHLFNEVLAARINALGTLMDGDMAMKHENGACFHVESAAAEQPRADAFEISPTGPLCGYRMTLPQGPSLAIEQEVFDRYGLNPADFRPGKGIRAKGARRALRVLPQDLHLAGGADEHGPFVSLSFILPPGSFATVLMREVMKSPEMATLSSDAPYANNPSDTGHEDDSSEHGDDAGMEDAYPGEGEQDRD